MQHIQNTLYKKIFFRKSIMCVEFIANKYNFQLILNFIENQLFSCNYFKNCKIFPCYRMYITIHLKILKKTKGKIVLNFKLIYFIIKSFSLILSFLTSLFVVIFKKTPAYEYIIECVLCQYKLKSKKYIINENSIFLSKLYTIDKFKRFAIISFRYFCFFCSKNARAYIFDNFCFKYNYWTQFKLKNTEIIDKKYVKNDLNKNIFSKIKPFSEFEKTHFFKNKYILLYHSNTNFYVV